MNDGDFNSGERWLPAVNGDTEDVPAFALVRIVEVGEQYEVKRVDSDNRSDLAANSELPIPVTVTGYDGTEAPGNGQVTMAWPAWVAYDSAGGEPEPGDTWGVPADEWKLKKGYKGFRVAGSPLNGLVPVYPDPASQSALQVEITELPTEGGKAYTADVLDREYPDDLEDPADEPTEIQLINIRERAAQEASQGQAPVAAGPRYLRVGDRVDAWPMPNEVLTALKFSPEEGVTYYVTSIPRPRTLLVKVTSVPSTSGGIYEADVLDELFAEPPEEGEEPTPETVQFVNTEEKTDGSDYPTIEEGQRVFVQWVPKATLTAEGFGSAEEPLTDDTYAAAVRKDERVGEIESRPTDAQGKYTVKLLNKAYVEGGQTTSIDAWCFNEETDGALLADDGNGVLLTRVPISVISARGFDVGEATGMGYIFWGSQASSLTVEEDDDSPSVPNVSKIRVNKTHCTVTDETNGVVLLSWNVYGGCTEIADGTEGLLSAPVAGQMNYVPYGDGFWFPPAITVKENDEDPILELRHTLSFDKYVFIVADGGSEGGIAYIDGRVFTGATTEAPGTKGVVPAPAAGDNDPLKYLDATANFSVPAINLQFKEEDGAPVVNNVRVVILNDEHFILTDIDANGTIQIDAKVFSGATEEDPGTEGLVPAPGGGQDRDVLYGEGSFGPPVVTVIDTFAETAFEAAVIEHESDYFLVTEASPGVAFIELLEFTGATAMAAGTTGGVTAPAAGDQDKTLHGDGTWRVAAATITVREVGGTPSYTGITTLEFGTDPFVLTNPGGAGVARIEPEWAIAADIQPAAAAAAAGTINKFAHADHVHEWNTHAVFNDTLHTDSAAFSPAKGKLPVGSGDDPSVWTGLGVGANGEVLTADDAQANGMKWALAVITIREVDSDPQFEASLIEFHQDYFTVTNEGGGVARVTLAAGAAPAPVNAEYLVLTANGTLTDERVFTPGNGLTGTDNGAGMAYDLAVSFGTGAGEVCQGNDARLSPTPLLTGTGGQHSDTEDEDPDLGNLIVGLGSTWGVKTLGTNGYPLLANSAVAGGVEWAKLPLGALNDGGTSESDVIVFQSGTWARMSLNDFKTLLGI